MPRQQVKTPLRWSDAESTVAAEVSRQRRMLVASDVAARPGVDTVPTVEFDMPSVVIVAPDVVFLVGTDQLPLQRLRQLGLLRPHQLEELGVAVGTGD